MGLLNIVFSICICLIKVYCSQSEKFDFYLSSTEKNENYIKGKLFLKDKNDNKTFAIQLTSKNLKTLKSLGKKLCENLTEYDIFYGIIQVRISSERMKSVSIDENKKCCHL